MGRNVAALSVENFSFAYPGAAVNALTDIGFRIERGDFAVLCGPSGSGKTTLLRCLKPILAPRGDRSGELLFNGAALEGLSQREQAEKIGFVLQSPEHQIVTDKVWHELAFGLESLGTENQEIRRRVAEMASFFGIQQWFYKSTMELSGGQKQLLNLASVMVMGPELLILDEPTGSLDPVAASDFLGVLGKINRELGTTIIMTEHRLEDALPLANRAIILDGGRLIADGKPDTVGKELLRSGHGMFLSMPTPMRVWAAVENGLDCPITVRDGRAWLRSFSENHSLGNIPEKPPLRQSGETAVKFDGVWLRYEKNSPDVLKGLELDIKRGSFTALMGGNGVGKTTALSAAGGLLKPYRGKITVNGRTAILPQDPQTVFTEKTVWDELMSALPKSAGPEENGRAARSAAALCGISGLLHRHPYDLSGGEQQRAALAKILLEKPDILLLDEPTKGLDAEFKQSFAGILASLQNDGATIITVSHDVEFCAEFAENCVMLFDGAAISQGAPREFFARNSFYTTAASRMARELLPEAVTPADIICACGGVPPEPPKGPKKPQNVRPPVLPAPAPSKKERSRPGKKSVFSALMILLLIPLTIFFGMEYLENRKYYFISLLVILECMAPFFLMFEGRRPMARELVTVAVLCALGVAGRAAFFMLPQFKPVMALVIISGAAFGGETGFLVGAMTMLVSNMFFGQGPLTPWQMFAMGLVGFLAGIIFRGNGLKKRAPMALFGFIAAVAVYGGIMNPAAALVSQGTVNFEMLLSYYAAGLPLDLIQAAATVLFLWLLARPMLEKLERIKTKYMTV